MVGYYESPRLAGYVCNEGSSPEWKRIVALVWQRYYRICAGLSAPVSLYGSEGMESRGGASNLQACRGLAMQGLCGGCEGDLRTVEGFGNGTSSDLGQGQATAESLQFPGNVDELGVLSTGSGGSSGDSDSAKVDSGPGLGSDKAVHESFVKNSGFETLRCHVGNETNEVKSRVSEDDGLKVTDHSEGKPVFASGSSVDEGLSEEKKSSEEKEKGKWYASNKRKRAARAAKARRAGSQGAGVFSSEAELAQMRARETLARKWAVENELAAERARRSLEVIRASDLQDDIRRYTTRVKRHTEANMVAIEKTHKYLSKTGNVAGEPAGGQGFAETIIGESISPDSSASMQEFRAAQKKILDLEQENEKLKKAYKKAGGNPDAIDLYDKSLYTMEDGTIAQHYVDQFEELKLTWGFPANAVEYRNGKKKTRVDFYGVRDEDGDDFANMYGEC